MKPGSMPGRNLASAESVPSEMMRREGSFPPRETRGTGRRQAVERQAWLRERGAWAEHWYTANAPTLDEQFPPITPTHLSFVTRVIDSVPVAGAILDAPCGTGRYFDAILAAGRNVMGIDLSAGMLAQARAKHPEVAFERIRLQDLGFEAAFDAAICVDAMEYVPPEDWPTVLVNLRRAVRPGGLIYLTVEQIDRAEVARAFTEAVAAGLPVVMGEHHRRGGGYHHYPTPDQVAGWLAGERLEVVTEGHSRGSNYTYLHRLVRARTPGAGPIRREPSAGCLAGEPSGVVGTGDGG
jgi:2-polyprenyl-3-methyl-5-hydroxy-6-metoxy-1,4-benzoquinol methylase